MHMLSFDSIEWMIELPFYYQLFLIYNNLIFTSIQSLFFQSYKCVHPIHWYLFCVSTVRRWTLHRNCIDRAAFMQNDFFIAQRIYSPRLLSFTSPDQRIHTSSVLFVAAERGLSIMYAAILVDNFKFCESNRRWDSSDLAAMGVPWHYTAAHFISSIVEVVAARLVDSLATLESSLCKLSVGLYFKSDSNQTYKHSYMHTYYHNEIFTLFLSEIRVCSMCMYVFYVSTE
jgi:hypothetical protein